VTQSVVRNWFEALAAGGDDHEKTGHRIRNSSRVLPAGLRRGRPRHSKAHDSGVTKAVRDCKPQEMVDLYEDDAIAVYPGEGEIGHGKGEIKGLVEKFFTAFCPD
jgi:hypothetical protein